MSRRARLAAALGAILGLALLVLWLRSGPPRVPPAPPDPKPLDAAGLRELGDLRGRARTLEERIAALAPKGTYVVIDTGRNLLTLVVDGKPSLTAVCSTGSGRALADPERRRFWVFDTPRGEHFVRRKYPQPVWIKPDWAFLEEGEPIPKSIAERLAPAELGAFAMDLGDGYLIHGTLYQRALGLSITHGCVRLGDHDLKMVYGAIKIGTPVYIF